MKKSNNGIGEEGIKHLYNYYQIDIGKIFLHPIFRTFFLPARYKFIVGSKDGGKTKAAAIWIVIRFLSNPYRNPLVVRKYSKDHATSTVQDILWAFNRIAELYDLPWLKPEEAMKFKNGGSQIIKYTKSTPQYFENTITKQKIQFVSLARLSSGGFSFPNPKHTCDTIWVEEMVQLEESDEKNDFDDSSFNAWRIAESTAIRGTTITTIDKNGKEHTEKITKENSGDLGLDFSWVSNEILFTNNAHNPDHWIMSHFGDKYVPLNQNNWEDCLEMENEKIRTYYDPNYMQGEGLYVARMTVFFNKLRQAKLMNQLRKDDKKEYAYIALGATRQIGGLAYEGHQQHLVDRRIEQKELDHLWPLSIGVDHAISATHKDWFAAAFLATDVEAIIVDSQRMLTPSFQRKIWYDEFAWQPNSMGARDDVWFAQQLIQKLVYLVETNYSWKSKIMDNGFVFSVDYNAASFMHTLHTEIQNFWLENQEQMWLKKISVIASQGKNTKVEIDGVKLNARKGRVERNKRHLDYGMIWIDKIHCPHIYKEFLLTAYDRKKEEVIDKNRDFVDAMDYSEMIHPIYDRFNKEAFNRKQILES